MDKWEHKIVELTGNDVENQKILDEVGKAGWELVSVGSQRAYFRRLKSFTDDAVAAREWAGIVRWD